MKIVEQLGQQEWWKKLKRYYGGLTEKERIYLRLLALFLLAVIGFYGLARPAYQYAHNGIDRYREQQQTLAWMDSNSSLIRRAPEKKAVDSLLGTANQLSQRFNIQFKRFEPVGENGVSLWIEQIPFNTMIEWLAQLEKEYGITVQEIAVERGEDGASINARLVLEG